MHPHSAGKLHASRATALYKATCDCDFPDKWRPSIFMPRSASRITLEIVSVRVDRLHDISEEDARNEGHEGRGVTRYESEARDWFRGLWDSINGKRAGCSWSDSPWVWVIEFRRVEK